MMVELPNTVWLRILANIGSGLAFSLMAWTAALLVWRKDIGHRTLIFLTVVFCLDRSIANFLSAWDLYAGGSLIALWAHLLSAVLALGYASWVFISREDILVTLLTTEEADRRRKNLSRDAEQARLNFEYIQRVTLESSRAARREQDQILKRETPPCPPLLQTGFRPLNISPHS